MPKKQCIGKTFVVGNFSVTVEDVIAEGGFAIVFLTKDNSTGRKYALKRMYVNTERDLAMCQQEIYILDALSKEPDSFAVRYLASTVNVIDEEVKEVLILLDYYKHSVLQLMNERFQAKRQLLEDEILNIFCDVCHAMGKLHNQRPPWIHRDLKVENVLIDKNGRCVLCDFGSATNIVLDPSKHSITDIEEELKKYTTISYRSPEMVNLYGIKRPITTKADIWALGVLLYKMCYFTLPFGESSLAIQNCNLQFPSQPAYSKHLQGLIRWCLRIDPEERPDIFQLAFVCCSMVNKECAVKNKNKSPLPNLNILLSQPETQFLPHSALETSPPRQSRPPLPATHEFSSTTSIAPRERPKPSTPSAGTLVLPPPPSKFLGAPLNLVGVPNSFSSEQVSSVTHAPSRKDQQNPRSPFQPVAGAVNPFRNEAFFHVEAPQRPQRMGHRRNTSDTSMIPVTRPMSPTPTQNVSEKSRSADTSPARSPVVRTTEIDKKFAGWNPFEEDSFATSVPAKTPSLTQSITSLVRKSSVGSMTKVAPVENGKAKPKPGEKEKKKKFRYQKFDNDSDVEDDSASDQVHSQSDDSRRTIKNVDALDGNLPPRKEKEKDTDSIGSASDLKHEDDTTDEESSHRPHLVPAFQPPIKPQDDEEDEPYETVQYGTLEETASAIQSLVSHQSMGHEVGKKPLLDDHNNGLDKSDEDELDKKRQSVPTPQRRLTFEGIGLLSVFDQIPFRQPKKPSAKDPSLLSKSRGGSFSETNPFAETFVTPPVLSVPPPVPPKPSFLKKEVKVNNYSQEYSPDEDAFGTAAFETLKESLVMEDRISLKKKPEKPRSPVSIDSASLIGIIAPGSPKLSKSPNRLPKFRKFQEKKEGISNISFEDA